LEFSHFKIFTGVEKWRDFFLISIQLIRIMPKVYPHGIDV
jgi:hypothetical protein